MLAASAGADGSALQRSSTRTGDDVGEESCEEHARRLMRQRRSKRVVEIDRLAAMPGGAGLGGVMLRIAGEATAATSSLTDVLVGPPAAMEGVLCV